MTENRCCSGRKRVGGWGGHGTAPVQTQKFIEPLSFRLHRYYHDHGCAVHLSHLFLTTSKTVLFSFSPPGTLVLDHMLVHCLSRPVCSVLQLKPGWKAGRHTKALLLYTRLQTNLKEGIVGIQKAPALHQPICRQKNNICKKKGFVAVIETKCNIFMSIIPSLMFSHTMNGFSRNNERMGAGKLGQTSYLHSSAFFGV